MKTVRDVCESRGHFSSLSTFLREATKDQKVEIFRQASERACEAQNRVLERARVMA